ncbi:glycosyltransferase family 4 protein [Streptomyces sp. NPDC002845]
MRVAVFVENRNGVGLASRIMSAPGADAHSFHLVTADRDGDVARWIEEEAAARLGGLEVLNLFTVDEALAHHEFLEELGKRISAFAEREGIDRLVFFNDRSQRGRRVAEALGHRLPLVLVQDGHLDFHYKRTKAGPQRDQNWYYGSSSSAAVCVWGPTTANHLTFRKADGNPPVHITGALGHSDDPALLRAARSATHQHAKAAGEPLRIVILDQPLADQRKLPRAKHRGQLKEMCQALSEFGEIEIKPHPSTHTDHLDWLRNKLPDVTVLDEKALLDAEGLDGYDLAVTFFSTTYLQTLRAGTPLVLFNPPPLNIVFPTINHPLLRNAGTVAELVEITADLQRTGKFPANTHGQPVEHFITFNEDVAERVLRIVEDASVPAERPTPEVGTVLPMAGGSRAELALRAVEERLDRPRSVAVLGLGFSYVTGVAIPVLTYTQALLAHSPVEVRYFDLGVYSGTEEILADLKHADVVLVNSLAPFWRSPIANELTEELLASGRPVALYAHETEYVMNFEGEHHTLRHKEMLALLPKLKVLCVSTAQADMFRQHGVVDPIVVYNTVPQDKHRPLARRTPGERPRIVMVGSMQDRKGLDLFSRVAELAHTQGLPWRFAWIGHRTWRIGKSTLLSDRVEWMGTLSRDRVREELAASDVFFLSSVDDPMPLSVVEAVQQRLRTVTYHRVGSREVLDGVPGYRSFAEYTPEAALDALRQVLDEEVSEDEYRDVEELFEIPAFTARMTTALGLPGPGDGVLREEDEEERFPPATSRPSEYLAEDFNRHFKAGNHDDALRVGTEILRRRQPAGILLGMAEIAALRGDVDKACELLAAAALSGGERARVWSEIGRLAALLGTRGRAIRQLARRESLRIQLSNHSSRLLKSD